MQEIIWSIQNGPGLADKRSQGLDIVFPLVEMNMFDKYGLELIKALPKPRLIKTHLNAKFFKRQLEGSHTSPKFVVVIRNPKDVLVSYFHFHQKFKNPFHGTWDQFFQLAQNKQLAYGDYYEHVLSWAQYQNHPNVLLVKYEDMKADPNAQIQRVAEFISKPINEEILHAIIQETSFESMKARSVDKYFTVVHGGMSFDNFFRFGKVGGWKAYFSDEQTKCLDDLLASKFHTFNLTFE